MVATQGKNATKNGGKFEQTFAAYLQGNERYAVDSQLWLPTGKADGRPCRLDALIHDRHSGERIAVSCKSQTSGGSVEEKIVYEIVHMSHLLASKQAERAYIVFLGSGWSALLTYVQSAAFRAYLPHLAWGRDWNGLRLSNFDDFVTRINRKSL